MQVVLFCHSLVSCWNHGNAHFLRGVVRELQARGHAVAGARAGRRLEPAATWCASRARRRSSAIGAPFPPDCVPTYARRALDLEQALDGADLVLVHEWNDARADRAARPPPSRRRALPAPVPRHPSPGAHPARGDGALPARRLRRRARLRRGAARDLPAPAAGRGAPGPGTRRPTCAASSRCPARAPELDLVWIGNWGDDERTAELHEFLLEPVRRPRPQSARSMASAIRTGRCAGCAAGGSSSAAGCPTTASRRPSPAPASPCTCRGGPTRRPCRASRRSACSRRWPAASRWSRRPGTTSRACSRPARIS